jgi:hypothetical protein
MAVVTQVQATPSQPDIKSITGTYGLIGTVTFSTESVAINHAPIPMSKDNIDISISGTTTFGSVLKNSSAYTYTRVSATQTVFKKNVAGTATISFFANVAASGVETTTSTTTTTTTTTSTTTEAPAEPGNPLNILVDGNLIIPVGSSANITYTVSGGETPYYWEAVENTSFEGYAEFPDNPTSSFLPAGLTFSSDANTATINGIPEYDSEGTYMIIVRCIDAAGDGWTKHKRIYLTVSEEIITTTTTTTTAAPINYAAPTGEFTELIYGLTSAYGSLNFDATDDMDSLIRAQFVLTKGNPSQGVRISLLEEKRKEIPSLSFTSATFNSLGLSDTRECALSRTATSGYSLTYTVEYQTSPTDTAYSGSVTFSSGWRHKVPVMLHTSSTAVINLQVGNSIIPLSNGIPVAVPFGYSLTLISPSFGTTYSIFRTLKTNMSGSTGMEWNLSNVGPNWGGANFASDMLKYDVRCYL